MSEIAGILDLDRYPLDDVSRIQGLVASCQRELGQTGLFNLEGLMRPAAVEAAADEIRPLMDSKSFTHSRWHNIYFEPPIDGVSDDHPALKLCETVNHTICADQMPSTIVFHRWLAGVIEWLRCFPTTSDPGLFSVRKKESGSTVAPVEIRPSTIEANPTRR